MSRLLLLILALLASPAQAQNSPCYWSGQLVKCLPTTGIYLDARRSVRYGDATTNYVELKAGASVTTYTLTLPTVQGGSGTTLSNNGSGVLTWITAGTGTVTSVSGTAPILVTGTTAPTVSITQSAAGTDGYLSSTDWGTFNGKQASGSYVTTARTISTTTPLAGGGDLSADRTFTIPAATSSANGYLSTTDWTTFNGRTPTARTISTTTPLAGGGSLAADRTFTIPVSTTSADGYLSSTDWTAFNGKTPTARTISTTAPITGGGDLSANRTFAIPKATGTVDGYLASTDWTTFNNTAGTFVATTRTISTTAPITGGGDLSANRTIAISAATSAAAGSITREDVGTWTATISGGFSGTPATQTGYYARSGSMATIQIDGLTGTSNANTQPSISAIPASVRPAHIIICPGQRIANSGVDVTALVRIATDGTMLIYTDVNAGTTFGTSGTKGLDDMTCTYPLN